MIRLLICEDSAEARSLLRTLLADHPEIEIVGEAADGREAIARTIELKPDVVLMDVVMPGVDGVTATQRIRELNPSVRIVAFTGSDDKEVVRRMIDAGANAYCMKGAPVWELERALAGASQPLFRLAHALTRSLASGSVAQLVARELAELTGAAFAATYVARGETMLTLGGMAGPSARPATDVSAPSLVVRAFTNAEPADADGDELAELYRLLGSPVGEALAVPFFEGAEVLGALLVAMPLNVQLEVDPELAAAVADLAAAALANERRLALTLAEARRDPLTGLQNRRAFDEHLDGLLERSEVSGTKLSLALLDLDDFKRINDEHGHATGDRVLREVSRVLLRSLRANEELFRIGGEEFALAVEGDAGPVVERLRTALAEHRRGEQLPTLSAGVARFPKDGATAFELFERADAALYAAKRAGKDRLARAEDVAPAGAQELEEPAASEAEVGAQPQPQRAHARRGLRVLVVDDDAELRMLLRTTLELVDIEIEEASTVRTAGQAVAASRPDVIVLDVFLPEVDGLAFCRELKNGLTTRSIPVVMLTGSGADSQLRAREAGADAFLHKPFSPLELLETIERLAGGLHEGPFRLTAQRRPEDQILLYARDLRRLLEIERAQRALIQKAYEETVGALVTALESKDFGTSAHSQRVRRYARELAQGLDARLLEDSSLEYGFLLHDVGKIGIPDDVLKKPGPLTRPERRLMEMHTVIGEQMLRDVSLLQGEGLKVIRSHHERWDGNGYPDGLAGQQIPQGGRLFAVADALDAMTSARPYRTPLRWETAVEEIVTQSSRQFDPDVVEAFREREPKLRRIYWELSAA
jgi:diguanylate cyclase (GGDEF)-like protein